MNNSSVCWCDIVGRGGGAIKYASFTPTKSHTQLLNQDLIFLVKYKNRKVKSRFNFLNVDKNNI